MQILIFVKREKICKFYLTIDAFLIKFANVCEFLLWNFYSMHSIISLFASSITEFSNIDKYI